VLLTEPLFLPYDAGVSARGEAELEAMLDAAARAGYQVRLAVIASPRDLGSVTALWGQPLRYAVYLGEELSLAYQGDTVVVMPDGVGLYRGRGPVADVRAVLSDTPAPGTRGLVTVALGLIRRLAAASDHPLPAGSISAVPAPPVSARPSPGSGVAWLVFALGAGLIAVAWTASLRARPPRLRHRPGHGAG
jgi:hypothetical protein